MPDYVTCWHVDDFNRLIHAKARQERVHAPSRLLFAPYFVPSFSLSLSLFSLSPSFLSLSLAFVSRSSAIYVTLRTRIAVLVTAAERTAASPRGPEKKLSSIASSIYTRIKEITSANENRVASTARQSKLRDKRLRRNTAIERTIINGAPISNRIGIIAQLSTSVFDKKDQRQTSRRRLEPIDQGSTILNSGFPSFLRRPGSTLLWIFA